MDTYKNIQMDLQKIDAEIDELRPDETALTNELQKFTDKRNDLAHYENELEYYKTEAKNEVTDRFLEMTQNKIDQMHEEIKNDQPAEDNVMNQIYEVEHKIDVLQKKAEALTKNELVKAVYTINRENSYYAFVKQNTETTEILDGFCHSGKDFLILKFDKWYGNFDSNYFAFIITKLIPRLSTHELQPTMTELKQNKRVWRLNDLRACVETAMQKYRKNKDKIILFDKPCLLGGQTSKDQTGFGASGPYQGKLYGEVTDFLIIGIITQY